MELNLKDVGPIPELKLVFPKSGSVLVVRGPNGSGKTTVIDTARTLITGSKHELTKRDQTLRGSAEGFGAKITLGQRTKRTGEVDVVSLEGRIDLAALVDPGFADKLAADTSRIKALVALAGKPAEPSAFYEAVGGVEAFKSLASTETQAITDPLQLAAKLKRDVEQEARRCEESVAKADQQVLALREAIGDTDLSQPHDAGELQARYTEAVQNQSRLQANKERIAGELAEYEERTKKLAQMRAEEAPETEKLEGAVKKSEAAIERLKKHAALLQEQLDQTNADVRDEEHRLTIAQSRLNDAEAFRRRQEELESLLRGGAPVPVGEQELAAAEERVVAARTAVEVGATVREALAKQENLNTLAGLRAKAEEQAAALRNAAKNVEVVLASLLPPCELRVDDGRLVLDTKRGETYFDDLSQGEKWKLAIDLAATVLGAESSETSIPIITCDQEAWESLDFTHRKLVHDRAKERNVIILTAEADHEEANQPLRVETYQP